jgi:hypothetical protein
MKTYTFPIGKLTEENRIVALSKVKELYSDATSDFTVPFKISVTAYDHSDSGDGEFYLGLTIGRVITELIKGD